jgi:hypothetical protein
VTISAGIWVYLHKLSILALEPGQLLALGAGQPIRALAAIALGLSHPVADRLGRRLELLGQLLGGAPGPDQLQQLAAELRRIRRTWSGHRDILLPQE